MRRKDHAPGKDRRIINRRQARGWNVGRDLSINVQARTLGEYADSASIGKAMTLENRHHLGFSIG